MSNDNARIVDYPRDGRKQENRENVCSDSDGHAPQHKEPEDCSSRDEHEISQQEEIPELIGDIQESESESAASSLLMEQSSSWQGLLPDPESFAMYPEEVQAKMVSWNDAQIIDQSKRLDKLADSVISQSKYETFLTFFLNAFFAFLTFFAFVTTNNPASFGMLAVPGISIAVNIAKDRNDKKQATTSE